VGLPAPVASLAIAPDGQRALLAVGGDMGGPYLAYVARFPSLKFDAFPLASPPIAVGIVPEAKRGFVAQKHPDGRITFIHLETGEVRTLTGFELASQVVYGDKK
jgi:hypothetical protein